MCVCVNIYFSLIVTILAYTQAFHLYISLNVASFKVDADCECLLRGTCVQKLFGFSSLENVFSHRLFISTQLENTIDCVGEHTKSANERVIWKGVCGQKTEKESVWLSLCVYVHVCMSKCVFVHFLVKEIRPLWNRCQTFISRFRNQYTYSRYL